MTATKSKTQKLKYPIIQKICKNCKKIIVKNPHESNKQHIERVSCSVECQSALQKGKPFSGKTFSFNGHKHSVASRKINSLSKKGLKKSKEHIEKARQARWKGKKYIGYTSMSKEELKKYTFSYRLKKNYNLDYNDYEKMVNSQKGLCALCGKENNVGKKLFVDHCHKTKRVRGLLCFNCNTTLGKVNDSIDLLKRMINYLTI